MTGTRIALRLMAIWCLTMVGVALLAVARGVQLSELLRVDDSDRSGPWYALVFCLTMAIVGFYFALSPRSGAASPSEPLRILSRYIKNGGWMLGIGCTLISIRVLAVLFGWLSH
jgi:hypothetical protein